MKEINHMSAENKGVSQVCDVVSVVIGPQGNTTTNHKSDLSCRAVADAAAWLASRPDPIPHVIPALKERFGLTGLQACQAIALARNITPQPGGQNDE
jgi:hypothetical protein